MTARLSLIKTSCSVLNAYTVRNSFKSCRQATLQFPLVDCLVISANKALWRSIILDDIRTWLDRRFTEGAESKFLDIST